LVQGLDLLLNIPKPAFGLLEKITKVVFRRLVGFIRSRNLLPYLV
jgi:hypothetical protein